MQPLISLWKLWLAAFLVRLVGVGLGLLFFPGWLVPPDTKGLYFPIARSLAQGTGYQAGDDPVEASRAAPLLPCLLALEMRLAGPDLPLWVPGIVNAACRAAGVVLIYLLAGRYFGPRAGLAAALLYLLDPWEAFWAGFVLKEPLGVPLFLLAVWLLSRLDDERSLRWACIAGAGIGLATLARFPNSALWVAAGLLLAFGALRSRSWAGWRSAAALLGCLTGTMLAVLSPWLLRNWSVVGQPVLSPHFAGQKFYTSNGPGIEMQQDGYYMPRGIDEERLQRAQEEQPPWQREGQLFSSTLGHIVAHPGEWLERIRTKLVNMWQPTYSRSSLRNWLVLGLPYCVWMCVSLAGLGLALWRRVPCRALLIPLVLFFCIHLVFWGEIRNRQYLTPLLFAFGGLALSPGRRKDESEPALS